MSAPAPSRRAGLLPRIRAALARRAARLRGEPWAPLFAACCGGAEETRLVGIADTRGHYRLRRLPAGSRFGFAFLCPEDDLRGVGLSVGEPSGDVRLRLRIEIGATDGSREVLEHELESVQDTWTDWPWFEFEPRPRSRGARVAVELGVEGRGAVSVREIRVPRACRRGRDASWLAADTGCRYRREVWRAAAPAARAPAVRGTGRPLRILTHRWHVAHQYELYKLPHRFVLAHDLPGDESRLCRRWAYDERPKPPNAVFAPWSEIRPEDFDLLLLHFDENVLDWENARPVLSRDWGASFRHLLAVPGKPRVAVCHGTPQFRGMCDPGYRGPLFEELPGPKRRLQELLGDTLVVCNSHRAREQWAFPRSRVIWHGFDPDEFVLGSRRLGILGPGRALDSRPHYRGKRLHDEVVGRLPADARPPAALAVPEPADFPWRHGNAYAAAKFRSYVRALGEYSVYFNPTLNSPMPRSRGEAMMCGLATVSAASHDVERFVDNERNGFFAADPAQLHDYLSYLQRHPQQARSIGERGRARALEVFHVSRYLDEWSGLLRELTG